MNGPTETDHLESTTDYRTATGPARSRRGFLRKAAATAILGVTGLAGCQELTNTPPQTATTHRTTTTAPPTQTPTATPTQTPTPTATQTQIPSPTSTPFPTRTRMGTPTAPVIDPSNLATYTSDSYPYTIKYPAGWQVNRTPADPDFAVTFDPPSGSAKMSAVIGPTSASGPITRKQVSESIRYLKQRATQDDATLDVTDRRPVTLPNGHRAILVDLILTLPSGVQIRGNFVLTIVNGTFYNVLIRMLTRNYTPTVKQGVNAIRTSLTIE